MNQLKLNLRKSPYDPRDYKIKVNNISPLKANIIDLSNDCTTVKNQGNIGSCTAFSVIGLMEYIYKKALHNGQEDIYSEKFTYYDTRVNQLKWPANSDSGAYLKDTIASVVKAGALPERYFPYNSVYWQVPPNSVYTYAKTNQVVAYAKVNEGSTLAEREKSLEDCCKLLEEGFPFVGGFICYSSIWNADVSKTGIIPLPGGSQVGGHAILIVGYDKVNRRFKFKNSWGSTWGDKGYGHLPFEYLLTGQLWDLWTIFKQENFSNTSIIGIEKPQNNE